MFLTVGVQADTRIVPNETKPECPFPAQLDIVQQMEQGRVSIALPIDIPFTEINRLMEAQLKGKTFPEDKSGAFTATIKSVSVAASGDRLLISVGVRANETKSWFGFGADATIHVWGRPILDPARQMLRLGDISLDVESQAAFGMLGAAARAALPYLEQTLSDKAVIDLVPLAQDARKTSLRRWPISVSAPTAFGLMPKSLICAWWAWNLTPRRCGSSAKPTERCASRSAGSTTYSRSTRLSRGNDAFSSSGLPLLWCVCACGPSAPSQTTAWRD